MSLKNTYRSGFIRLMPNMIAFIILLFVLVKPVRTFITQLGDEKIELCSLDTEQEQEDSELENSIDEDSINETLEIDLLSIRKEDVSDNTFIGWEYTYGEYDPGIPVPPPEL